MQKTLASFAYLAMMAPKKWRIVARYPVEQVICSADLLFKTCNNIFVCFALKISIIECIRVSCHKTDLANICGLYRNDKKRSAEVLTTISDAA